MTHVCVLGNLLIICYPAFIFVFIWLSTLNSSLTFCAQFFSPFSLLRDHLNLNLCRTSINVASTCGCIVLLDHILLGEMIIPIRSEWSDGSGYLQCDNLVQIFALRVYFLLVRSPGIEISNLLREYWACGLVYTTRIVVVERTNKARIYCNWIRNIPRVTVSGQLRTIRARQGMLFYDAPPSLSW